MREVEVRKNVDDIGSVLHIEVLVSLSPKSAEVRFAAVVGARHFSDSLGE